jgi:hypothetical protein
MMGVDAARRCEWSVAAMTLLSVHEVDAGRTPVMAQSTAGRVS